MRPGWSWLLLVVAASSLAADAATGGVARAEDHGVTVTSTDDTGAAVCPSESNCTLRGAILLANADAEPGNFTITFDPEVFPLDEPATIAIGNTPLPTVERTNVVIDGDGAGVIITNGSTSLSQIANGITASGAGFSVLNLAVRGFTGICVSVSGAGSVVGAPGAGLSVGGCGIGISIAGEASSAKGNAIGFEANGAAAPVASGIVVSASNVTIGGLASDTGAANRIGFADTGVFVGADTTDGITGVVIQRNVLGLRPNGEAAAVKTAVLIAQPSNGTLVNANDIRNAISGIAVAANRDEVATTGNTFSANRFRDISGLAIDLGADGVRNPNDLGDTDQGPNGLLNSPVIDHATQSSVSGTACAGCSVSIYLAAHTPGGSRDFGTAPLPVGVVTAGAGGQFVLPNPAASAGDWLVAIATDSDGNTSEFGTSIRLGSGAVLCGNVQLQPGWNHVGFFGGEPVALLTSFAADPVGAVTAIYHATGPEPSWERWFKDTPVGRTLQTVQPGEAYWMFATAPVTLTGGFSISFPVPVALHAGVNDFVYLGASAHVLDALASLGSSFRELYRFDATSATWERFGDPSVPAWAQDFAVLEACGAYQLRLEAPAVLTPLQP